MALVKPGGDRHEHKVYDTTDRTCYLCHRLVSDVGDVYYTTDNKVVLCKDHKDSDGIHGQFADPKHKPKSPFSVVRLMHSSTYRSGSHEKKRAAVKPVEIKAKDANEEFGDGDVTPEIKAFLEKMGRG